MSRINEEDTQPSRLHPETNLEKPVILKGDFAEGERTLLVGRAIRNPVTSYTARYIGR